MGLRSRISELSLSWVSGQEDNDPASWRDWAIGVDCHSKFLAVCVLVPDFPNKRVKRIQKRIDANFAAIRDGKRWIEEVLRASGQRSEPFSYCLESTGCYHCPVVHAWAGEPCVINPALAGASRRKTDKLDAQTLARNHLSGLWPRTWFPTPEILELRSIDRARRSASKTAHRSLMSIGSHLLSFGYTFTSANTLAHQEVRPNVEDVCQGKALFLSSATMHLSGVPLPQGVRDIILDSYKSYDRWRERANLLEKEFIRKAKAMAWPTAEGSVCGKDLVKRLTTAPGVGDLTAVLWLSQIGDPKHSGDGVAARSVLSEVCRC